MTIEFTPQPSRSGLSKARVLGAALALADRDGIESLTMRKLAGELGVGTMSVYYYVANKDELLDEMVDVVYSEIELAQDDTPWKATMRERGIALRQALRRHAWAIVLMESRITPGPANLRHHDEVLKKLFQEGFSIEMAVHAYNAIDSYVYGFALQERSLPFDSADEVPQVAEQFLEHAGDEYPHLTQVGAELARAGFDYGDEFGFGLDLILDALERTHDRKR